MIYGLLATCACAVVGGLAFLYSGVYNIATGSQHTRAVYWALERGMRASVRTHAAGIVAPSAFDAATLRKGAHCFHALCVQCHGGPGQPPADFAGGLLPAAKNLLHTAHELPVEQVYWITRNGIRLTAMPAWEFRLDDSDLWAIAAFVDQELPGLTVEQYRERIAAASGEQCQQPASSAPPDATRGRKAMHQYGCQNCHIIPGIRGPQIHVGPSLRQFAKRPLIAGTFPNTPENVLRWLRAPQSVRPRTLMPDLNVTEQHALDMRAYLATLE
jgi:mono/diheme cytochrome c family protein